MMAHKRQTREVSCLVLLILLFAVLTLFSVVFLAMASLIFAVLVVILVRNFRRKKRRGKFILPINDLVIQL